ncbi:bola protein [Flagelloscypha sp. PMI_526]|nr:bola protein [Flagelloscypha sp. PMI_526]
MGIDTKALEDAIRNAVEGISHLEIEDQSSGCGENYAVLIVSEAFQGKTTLARHRWINSVLQAQISQMHAFSQVP